MFLFTRVRLLRFVAIYLLAVAVLSLFAGCGGGDPEDAGEPTTRSKALS